MSEGRVPSHRLPTSPGEMLLEEFLKPLGVGQARLAHQIGVPEEAVREFLAGERRVDEDLLAYRLSRRFGTTARFWLNGQALYDKALAEGEDWYERPPVAREEEEGGEGGL